MCCNAATLFQVEDLSYFSAAPMKNSIVPLELSSETAPAPVTGPAAPASYPGQEWGGYPPDEERSGGGLAVKLRRYWAAVKRFWWLVAGFTILGTAAGLAATQYVKPVYEAKGTVWISDVSNPSAAQGPVRNPELLPTGSWVELFRDPSVVDSVVVKQQLWYTPLAWQDSAVLSGVRPTQRTEPGMYTLEIDKPVLGQYTLTEAKRGVVDKGIVGDSIGRRIGLAWNPAPATFATRKTIRFAVGQPRPAALMLINQLEIVMGENSNFMQLKLTGSRKWKTADILNAWIAAFIAKATELRRRNLDQTGKVLEERVAVAQRNYDEANAKLIAFRAAHATELRETPSISAAVAGGGASDVVLNDLFRFQTEYKDVHRDRLNLEELAAQGRQGIPITPEDISSIPSAASSPTLAELQKELLGKLTDLRTKGQTYTEQVPEMIALKQSIDELRKVTIPNALEQVAQSLKRREDVLLAKQQDNTAKLDVFPQTSVMESSLRNEVNTAEGILTQLQNKLQTTETGAASSIPDVTPLSPAAPAASSQAGILIILVGGGIFGSLGFGIVLALALDMIDHRFRYPEQISDELRLDILGAVPAVPKPGEAADPEATLQSIEAFRGLRMNMHHAFDAPPVMLTISSPGAGDGKSMISSNLALSFADAGYRTLLIDGDIRRGKLHNVFDLERRPGLLDYLAGDAEITETLRKVPMHAGLTIIPSGTRRHRGPELLTSARLPALLNWARGKYDVVLIDSAPLAAGVDAYALGVATGSMILIMRTGVTDRRVAKAKLKLMERMPIRMLGAVVNAVPAAGLYSEYSYLYGYQPDIDVDSPKTDPLPALQSVDPPR